MKLEEKIALLRKRNGWSQEELAFRLDVSRQSVSKWEMGASVPDLDKILKMSELFGCTTDYLLKDGFGEDQAAPQAVEKSVENEKSPRQVCDEEGEHYLALVKKQSWRIATGVAVCILSPVCMFVLLALSAAGYPISEDFAGGIGTAALLAVCAVGVTFLIVGGISLSKYDYLEKEIIVISEILENEVRARREHENKGFITAIAIGVSLCILSAAPLLISAGFEGRDEVHLLAIATLFPIAATGVFLFVKFGMIRGSYTKLLQEEEYTVQRKKEVKRTSVFAGVYWCLITALYLGVSFWTMAWHRTWIVWPVAGVLFAGLQQIIAAVASRKEKGKK